MLCSCKAKSDASHWKIVYRDSPLGLEFNVSCLSQSVDSLVVVGLWLWLWLWVFFAVVVVVVVVSVLSLIHI